MGAGITALSVGMTLGARSYLNEFVLPRLETYLGNLLDRRVDLGDLVFIWPWQLTLGQSSIEDFSVIRSIDLRPNWSHLWQTGSLNLDIYLNQPHVLWTQTPERGWQELQLSLDPTQTSSDTPSFGIPLDTLQVKLQRGRLTLVPLQGERLIVEDVSLMGSVQIASTNPEIQATGKGYFGSRLLQVQADVDLISRQSQIKLTGSGLPLEILPSFVPQLPASEVGGQADLELQALFQPQESPNLQIQAQVTEATLKLNPLALPLTDLSGSISYADQRLSFVAGQATYGKVSGDVQGSIQFRESQAGKDEEKSGYNLQIQIPQLSLEDLQTTFTLTSPWPTQGSVTGELTLTGELDSPVLSGRIKGLGTAQVDQLTISAYETDFQLSNGILDFERIQGQSSEAEITGSGQVRLETPAISDFQLNIKGARAAAIVAAYGGNLPKSLGSVDATVRIQARGDDPILTSQWQATGGDIQGSGQARWQSGILSIPQASLTLGEGTVHLKGQLIGDLIKAEVIPDRVNLDFFRLEEPGQIQSGTLQLEIPRQDLTLAALAATGHLELTGVRNLGTVQVEGTWDGSSLSVTQGMLLNLPQLNVPVQWQGRIPVDPKTLDIGSLALTLQAQNLTLSQIPNLPLNLKGLVDITATVTGKPTPDLRDLSLEGALQVKQAGIAALPVADFQGSLLWRQASTQLNLYNDQDQIQLSLGEKFRPKTARINWGDIQVEGQEVNDQFQAQVTHLPLTLFGETLQGNVNSKVAIDWETQSIEGEASLAAFRLGDVEAKKIQVGFRYAPGSLALSRGQLDLFDSQYTVSGSVNWQKGAPLLNLAIGTTNGRLQDIVSAFKWQNWSDITTRGLKLPPLGPAAGLAVDPIETSGQKTSDQLQVFQAVLDRLVLSAQQGSGSLFPPPTVLKGDFQGQVQLTGSLRQPQITFTLEGQNWIAEEFRLDTLKANGSLENGLVQVSTLQLQTGERIGSFAGKLSTQQQQGQLTIQQFPLALFQRFLPETFKLNGDLNAEVAIAGNLQNPQAKGQIDLLATQINQIPIQQAKIQFDYGQGQLQLDSQLQIESEPIEIKGTIPYPLPFTAARAASDELDLSLQIPNAGLKLANLFTDQVTWQAGESQLDLQVRGNLREPILEGNLVVQEGVAQFKLLPDPVTNIQGQITFNLNQLEVSQLTGQYGSGSLKVQGSLPINSKGAARQEGLPLEAVLEGIQLNLPDLYKGEVDGSVTVGGVLLQPTLQGSLVFSEGQVFIGNSSETKAVDSQDPAYWQPSLNNLKLVLGSNLDIVRGQLFDLKAVGELQAQGSIQNPRLQGTLKLDRGRVNLPIANFRLDRSRNNTAIFVPENGLDPLLDLHLITQATEVFRASQSLSPFQENEVQRLPGSQQQIDIQAVVRGRASELSTTDPSKNIVTVSSVPPRTPEEIFALLGGNALATLQTSPGVAGVAGLTDLEGTLGTFLGLDDIRLSPISQISTNAIRSSAISLGLELVKDVGSQFSASTTINLTDSFQPTRQNIRYRLDPQTLLRFSTDFEGNNSTSIEFETRF
jgi:translocation and assembly module TamB